MAHYFCIAIGMADCTPNSQDYHTAETESEFREIVKSASDDWVLDVIGMTAEEFERESGE